MAKKKAKKKVAKKSVKRTAKRENKVVKKAAKKTGKKVVKKKTTRKKTSASTGSSSAPVGGIIWSEVHVDNPEQVHGFYANLFGWQKKSMPMGPGDVYRMLSNQGVDFAGVVNRMSPSAPAIWLNFFYVKDVDAVTNRAISTGARILTEPMDLPVGRMSILRDPGGAAFALFKPAPR